MRDAAHALIEAGGLHESLQSRLKQRYSLDESGQPSAALNVSAETDDDGNVTKRPMEALVEAVEEEIKDALDLQSTLGGTRTKVRGQGRQTVARSAAPVRTTEAKETDENGNLVEAKEPEVELTTGSPLTDALLIEAGMPAERLPTIYATA
jgi:hypothetical protein